ncbi:ABC transporter substrate-binding protein [Amycolatopsis sacchari]|uniref:Peptide/nickel transport system substrate-binding protein n=1 Tax=Amycolatopsis sacchari TaxID=115433 RepID=A0A1I3WQD0_9PSEU|nr:ABC transporter substrate-binding protein [Amycolatopsis sacchari]SFK09728.1 peptide/nickel transport system substrate-binding protein [Amycolatopsis sacchari]
MKGNGASLVRRRPHPGKPRWRKAAAAFAVGLAVVSLTAACGGGTGSGSADRVLNIGFPVPPESMDPAKLSTDASLYANLAYDPLIYRAPDGSLQPRLATSWNYVGTGNKLFELKLRPDVRFSDGSPLTADVVKTNIEHFKKTSSSASLLAAVASIEAPDPLTVRVSLSQPNPILPVLFTQDFLAGNVASGPALAQPDTLATQSAGAGPYVLDPATTVSKDHYTYVPNPQYWNKNAVHYDRVVVKVLTNANTALAAIKTGQVDVLRADYTTADAAKSAGLQIAQTPLSFIGLNLTDRAGQLVPALGDVRVRQALNYAVDRQKITKALFGDYGTPTEQIQLPGEDGYNPQDFYGHDPAKARQLLAEAGYPNGFTLPVLTRTTRGTDLVIQAMADDLKQVGVQVQLTTQPDFQKYTQDLTSGKYPAYGVLAGALPIYAMGQLLFLPNASVYNPQKSSDDQLQSLYEQASVADDANRARLDQQVVRRLVELAWLVPVVFTPNLYYSRPMVGGVEATAKEPKANPVEWFPKS